MAGDGRRVRPLRPTPLLVAMSGLLVLASALFLVTATVPAVPPWLNWLPIAASSVVLTRAAWRTSKLAGRDPLARRLWQDLTLVALLVLAGIVGDFRHALADPSFDGVSHDLPTAIIYGLSILSLIWMLIRLPTGQRREINHTARFALDAATVGITTGIIAWFALVQSYGSVAAAGPDVVPMLVLAALGLCGSLAFVKISMIGMGGLDGVITRLLALAAALGAAGGGLTPLLVDLRPGLSSSHVTVCATMLCAAFAADRQRRITGVRPVVRPRRRSSLVPYVAVAATDGLLLWVGATTGGMFLIIAIAAVLLTALVALRQVHALLENDRLLRRVDAGQAQLAHRASHDHLTDLANRTLFEQRTREALLRSGSRAMSLALIDLDDFKAINDRLGHAVGDALLVVVAARLKECVRGDDLVARLGGDEFGLILDGLRGDEATEVLDRITEALRRPVHALGYDLLVSASVGLAEGWADAAPQELLRRADLAMYAAKEGGKGRHAVYDAELEKHQAADAELGAALRQALDNGEFTLVYQPIVRLPDGHWTGMETLIRWHRPDRGFVGPDTFIPIAERTGLIVPLGDWILRTALRQAAEWDRLYGDAAPREIGINVSARQLREPGFANDVKEALAETGFDPERVVVEVTETAVFDGGVALDTLQNLVGLGVKVALDDFGTGHSSLGLLRTCPVDTLKVDKSFVDGIGGRSEEAVIATAMIQITNGLHLQAVAEGVETAEQAETLYRLGYRFAQGYHFSRPLSPAQVAHSLEQASVAA
ncbi:putative bifunctional diguanylate cyclase/phosphodiesterase [Actinoplanes sp. NPDC049265]|uniref:putative bifunctional diguanylate cyclase/phosphodiesterase n=1 Tax=Actinoplanes sp. NPDC049265 TaxID=3363902 RepID=UPI00371D18B6